MSLTDRVAHHAPLLIVYLDRDLRVQFANMRCDELLGQPAEALHGRLLAELVDAGTLRYALEHVAELERGNAAPREYLLCDKEGTRRAVHVHAATERDAEGRAIGYVACAQRSGLNFAELVAGIVCELDSFAAERGVRVELRSEAGETRVAGEARVLGRALTRLVSSAIERSARGELVRVHVGARGDRASLAAYDQNPAALAPGHLGLSIARACIERLGGTVEVACSDAGAALRAELPRLEVAAEQEAA